MNSDKIAGAIKEEGGKAREAIGNLTGDKKAQALGVKDQVAGNIQKNFGKVKDAAKDALED